MCELKFSCEQFGVFKEKEDKIMELYPSWLRKLWKEWDLRVMVILSLSLQILLIFLGNRRKYSNKSWIRIVVWSAYTTADYIATFALAILSSYLIELYDKDHDVAGSSSSLDANTQLSAFWAPFLVLHLGGPDTITAYALEDNELWLRPLFCLVIQTGMALSIFLMSWTAASSLSILSLVMFLLGIIKYGERTWVLRSSTRQKRRNSSAMLNNKSGDWPHLSQQIESEVDALPFARDSLFVSTKAFLDDNTSLVQKQREDGFNKFRAMSSEYAFKVIEIELGLIYDKLYTKAPLLYTRGGLVLRMITFFLTCSVMVLFPVLVDKHKYSKVDLSITYLLIIVAVIHDIYAALLMVLSDTFAVWLIKYQKQQKDSILMKTFDSIPLLKRELSTRRWSNNMSQFSLLSFTSRKAKPWTSFKLLNTRIEMGKYWHFEVSEDLKKLIFTYVKEKAEDAETSIGTSQWRPPFTELPSTRGIPTFGQVLGENIEYNIKIWHVATEFWYYLDRHHFKQDDKFSLKCKLIKRISRYMMYLLVERTSMFSSADEHGNDPDVSATRNITRADNITSKAEACQSLLETILHTPAGRLMFGPAELLCDAVRLVNELNDESQSIEDKWEFIKSTWMDTLGYVARNCKGNEHAQQLRREKEDNNEVISFMVNETIEGMGSTCNGTVQSYPSDTSHLSGNLIELYDKKLCDKDHDVANTQLSAFWAPFLLLHLGGPDTITAYALEDNELWLRHVLGIFVQTGMALSIFLMSWTASSLSTLSLVMFLPGISKYEERTLVLRSTTIQKRRESSRSLSLIFISRLSHISRQINSEEDALRFAEEILFISKLAFLDDKMVQDIRRYSFDTFRAMSPKYAFKVIEIELGMMYDLLYTKAPLLYTRRGLVLRLRSFVLTCSVMVLFPVLVDNDKQKYSKVDLSITYLLIIVAVIHDINAALLMVLSDTFAVWLIEHRNDSIIKTLNCFPLMKRQPSNNITRRWSNKMPQYSVPSSKAKPWMSFKLLNKRIEMGKYWHCEVSEDLRKLIFESLGQQVQQLIKSINRINQGKRINDEFEFEYSIIIWHIATEVWYYSDRDDFVQTEFRLKCKMIKRVSRYMMYLLVERPSILSLEDSTHRINFRDIRKIADKERIQLPSGVTGADKTTNRKAEACKRLLEEYKYLHADPKREEELIYLAMERVRKVNQKYQTVTSYRKYSNKLRIRIVAWSAYITADSVATFALGILSSNLIELYDKDPDVAGSSSSLDANTQLSAVWAPFLVLHLGGPDTITAYALEDNELWLRDLLGLVVQTGMAISIFLMSWTAASRLSILSLVMLLPGIIKYGERTWVLRSNTRKKRRASSRSFSLRFNNLPEINSEEDALSFADVTLVILSNRAFLDDTMDQNIRRDSFMMFRAIYVVRICFQINRNRTWIDVRVVLHQGTITLYSSALSLYWWGHTSAADHFLSHLFTLLLVLSDTFAAWLKRLKDLHNDSILTKTLNCFPLLKRQPSTSTRRWSKKMSQCSVLTFTSRKAKPQMSFKLLNKKIEMGKYWHCEVSKDLRELIFKYSTGVGINTELEFCIIPWHIATEVWYYLDKEKFQTDYFRQNCRMIKRVSRHMMYLLVERRSMLSLEDRDRLIN
ncbi:hypothetical protein EZV62_003353 [Acer yangbiense]|uniref:DUF4220 domain-containing protein n=1 Tax=Acer yangbiense TaxID=1000413 RepID=A0A5C7IH66_9ROSI|nr:hypothetical protein EZV62_003353 [Acer yangbiense]